jgi:hypothetical protein
MKILTSSLITKLTGGSNTLTTALSGRFYNEHGPEQEVFPYCIFRFVSEVPTQMLDSIVIEECIVQFNLYSQNQSSSEAYDLYDKMISLLDESTLSIAGYTHIRLSRELAALTFDSDDTVWDYMVRYRLKAYKK